MEDGQLVHLPFLLIALHWFVC